MSERRESTHVDIVVFDLDGTLVDSRDDIASSINAGLTAVGSRRRPFPDIYPLIGLPLVDMYVDLLPRELTHRADEAAEAYRTDYTSQCSRRSAVFPGVLECLDSLRGSLLAIATSKRTYQAVRVAEELGLAGRFKVVNGTDGIPPKPNPAVVLQVIERTGASAERSWMVGDTTYDIRAGRSAGLRTCAVTYGAHSADALAAEHPDAIVDSLADLPARISA
ncbi:MAG: HAD family hydrolase [Polyangia bacterium]